MTRPPARYLLVSRVLLIAAAVAGLYVYNSIELFKRRLHAPETAPCEYGTFLLSHCFLS
ncbi:MAG: hypothetical protein ACWGOX_03060 [Desulforhopalus sp.]